MFAGVVALLSILGIHEGFRLLFPAGGLQEGGLGRVSTMRRLSLELLAYGAGVLIIYGAFRKSPPLMMMVVALNLMAVAFFAMTRFDGTGAALEPVFRQSLAVVYVPLFLAHLVLIRNSDAGQTWIYFMLCVVFAGDMGAFYAGTYGGRHKLCPSISPGKTLEGAVGGLASAVAVGFLFRSLFLPHLPPGLSLVFLMTMETAAQMGDLFESMLKRAAGVKDSGGIFPGHGGVLDRMDALLFAAPVGYVFKEFLL